MKSPAITLYLEPFKAAAAEGAAVELKLRLLAGSIPALEKYAYAPNPKGVEDEVVKHFGDALSASEKETLSLCRQLRNKMLHSDFCAARGAEGTTPCSSVALRTPSASSPGLTEDRAMRQDAQSPAYLSG